MPIQLQKRAKKYQTKTENIFCPKDLHLHSDLCVEVADAVVDAELDAAHELPHLELLVRHLPILHPTMSKLLALRKKNILLHDSINVSEFREVN